MSSERRVPQEQTTSSDEATPTASGQGVRGAGPGERESDLSDQAKGRSHVEDAEQMGDPGEGAVADAVKGKSGTVCGTQPGSESDLDRKKAEQAPARDEVQSQQWKDLDEGAILGQKGGTANPVDKNNYSNTGSRGSGRQDGYEDGTIKDNNTIMAVLWFELSMLVQEFKNDLVEILREFPLCRY